MLDHYLHTAHIADMQLFRHGETTDLTAPQPGVSITQISGQKQAISWFVAERRVLLAAVRHAADNGSHTHACQPAWALFVFLHRHGHWHDRVASQHAALKAARQLGSESAEARAHRQLGFGYADHGRFDDAHLHLRRALDLAEQAADPAGQAWPTTTATSCTGSKAATPQLSLTRNKP